MQQYNIYRITNSRVEAGIEKSEKAHEQKIGRGYLAIPFAKISAPQTFVLK